MEPTELLNLLVRWLHLVSAALAVGVPIFMRFVLIPARAQLEESQRAVLHEAVMARWRRFVHVMIVVFLATGLWTFLGAARWREFDADGKFRYHLLFGIKLLLALVMFFISSALAGRSAALAGMRAQAKTWVGVLILLGLIVVALGSIMRFMDRPRPTTTSSMTYPNLAWSCPSNASPTTIHDPA